MAKNPVPAGEVRKEISRADLRSATIRALTRVKSDPRHVKLTSGQRSYITKSRTSG